MAQTYDFVARKGSTSRSLEFTIDSTNPDDDFSGVVSVKFYMRSKARGVTTNKVDGVEVASFEVAEDGKSVACRYDWQAADVNEEGKFLGYAKTTDAAGKTDRFPAEDDGEFINILIQPNFES
ncbi:MAG: hypothetical protein J0I20_35775 [Chloroflexi bacterium]|nr:hypothetical protein [Chloroflexota bacterium]OJV86964.1 MAG: hypothetical protein BGO39_28590 [Chloroflexi bacterium 54-19]